MGTMLVLQADGKAVHSSAGPVAYICTTVRNEASLQLFMQAAAEAHLAVMDCSDSLQAGSVHFLHRLKPATKVPVVLHAVSSSVIKV